MLISRIPTCAWLYVTRTMSNSSSLCGYRTRKRAFTASNACGGKVTVSNSKLCVSSVTVQRFRLNWHVNLDEGEGRSRGEGFVLVLDLVPQVLLHSLLLEHLLLPLGPKQDPRGDGDGDGVLRLRLRVERPEEDGWAELRAADVTNRV